MGLGMRLHSTKEGMVWYLLHRNSIVIRLYHKAPVVVSQLIYISLFLNQTMLPELCAIAWCAALMEATRHISSLVKWSVSTQIH